MSFCCLAVLRLAGSLQKSTEVMKAMQSLIKVPEIQATMRDLSKEMTKVSRADLVKFPTATLEDNTFFPYFCYLYIIYALIKLYCLHVLLLGWHHGGNAGRHI